MLRKIMILLFLTSLFFIHSTFAQTLPTHNRLLYSHTLTNGNPGAIGTVNNLGGSFTADGWLATKKTSQLLIELAEFLPFEGTVEVKVKGLMPSITDDWTPISLWSRGSGNFYDVDPTAGSYVFLKTDESLVDGSQVAFKAFSCSYWGGYWDNGTLKRKNRQSEYPVAKRVWDPNHEYLFQITWTPTRIWILVDNSVVYEKPFTGQKESFGYIFLGKDNTYVSMPGVTYRDLRIYAPETNYPFSNIARSSNVYADKLYGGQGVTATDITGDGLQDIYVSLCGANNLFYIQNADGSFSEQAAPKGIDDSDCSFSSLFYDFDKDGDMDFLQVNYQAPSRFYVNQGDNTFTDQTSARGILTDARNSTNALAVDVNHDGYMDIYVANADQSHDLYINQKNGTFSYRELTGIPTGAGARAVAGDVNGDGYVDIFYTRRGSASVLLINDGNGNFTDEAAARGADVTARSNSPLLMDYDNDGDLDIFIAVGSTTDDINPLISFLENQGDGTFVDKTNILGLRMDAYGLIAGDIDNDGYQDLYVLRRDTRVSTVEDISSRLFHNNGDGTFTELTGTGAEIIYADGRGSAMADFNNDGLLDIYAICKGSAVPDNHGRYYLLRNDNAGLNNYLKVTILDSLDHPNGMGAQIWVYQSGHLNNPLYLLGYRDVSTVQGYQSQSSLIQHFGLGAYDLVDIRVRLSNGQENTYTNIASNQLVELQPSLLIPSRLDLVSGDNQTGKAGQPLPQPIVVEVTDDQGKAVSGHPVQFSVTAGNGTLNGTTDTNVTVSTNSSGRAQVTWTMGPTAGIENTLSVSSSYNGQPLTNSPITLSVTPGPDDPAVLHYVSGNNQQGYINQTLDSLLVVKVTDQHDNVIANHPVHFQVKTGNGLMNGKQTAIDTVTDADGYARVSWMLGDVVGTQQAEATSSYNGTPLQNSPMLFTATAQEPQRILSRVSARHVTGTVNQPLAQAFQVKLKDFSGNPISGQTVTFKVISGGGNFSGNPTLDVATGADGIASATATLGTVAGDSNNVFQAVHSGAQGSPITFKATALPGPAVELRKESGDSLSGTVNRYLPQPFIVRVVDAFGNGVSGYSVVYTVKSGGGKIHEQEQFTTSTDPNGYASATLRLGTTAGTNTVEVSASGLQNSPLTFTAQGNPGDPARLNEISGNGQQGDPGVRLSRPFVVSVTDSFYNPIQGHEVVFAVTAGGGNIDGQAQVVRTTNSLGQASATLTLGTTDFYNEVTVTSQFNGQDLINSPMKFTATTGPGDPYQLVYVSGDSQVGKINDKLPQPFRVKVADEHGIPITNHPVTFVSFTSGAHFAGSKTTVTVQTDQDGIASVDAWIGSVIADNYYEYEAQAKFNGINLQNSPYTFRASGRITTATRMYYVSGDGLSGIVGQTLDDSLKVFVADKDSLPVKDHPVTFSVVSGNARLNGANTSVEVLSAANGIAAVSVKLGDTPGKSKINVTSSDGKNPLLNSGSISFNVQGFVGPPDRVTSKIETDKDSLIADGVDAAEITVTLLDYKNNPVSGKTVQLFADKAQAAVVQPTDTTDTNGQAKGSVTCTLAGVAKVWAVVDGQVIPQDSLQLHFLPGNPAKASVINNYLYAERGHPLPEPVGYEIRDAFNNPIPGLLVKFEVKAGGGYIDGVDTVRTDEQGRATVKWVLGRQDGDQKLQGVLVDYPNFTLPEIGAISGIPGIKTFRIVRGDKQIGLINRALPDSFVVEVRDSSDYPISGGYRVNFELISGQGTIAPTSAVLNAQGRAAALFYAGSTPGAHEVRAKIGSFEVSFRFIIEKEPTLYLADSSNVPENARPLQSVVLKVQTLDAFSRVVSGDTLLFKVKNGKGTVTDSLVVADTLGFASTTWRFGTEAGTQTVQVKPYSKASVPLLISVNVINSAPVLTLIPPDTFRVVDPGKQISLSVSATDPDGDVFSLSVANKPSGAYFNPGTGIFEWTPTNADRGVYPIYFIATDQYGAADTAIVNIRVGANQPPIIFYFFPEDSMVYVSDQTKQEFLVYVIEPDEDAYTVHWFADGKMLPGEVSGDTARVLIPISIQQYPDSLVDVTAIVSDGDYEVKQNWHVKIWPTLVELSSFQAEASSRFIRLSWKTAAEKDNIGFNVLRSDRTKGPFMKINETLIPPQSDGLYFYVDEKVQPGKEYFYKIQDMDRSGSVTEHGPVSALVPVPSKLVLQQNYPNPFNPTTSIGFELPEAEHVRLVLYNISGQIIRTLVNSNLQPGVHQIVWDARDESGKPVTSGIYYYRLYVGDKVLTKKLLLTK